MVNLLGDLGISGIHTHQLASISSKIDSRNTYITSHHPLKPLSAEPLIIGISSPWDIHIER